MSQMMAIPNVTTIIIIVAVIVLLFGAQKIPQLMRGLGSGVNEFKKGMAEGAAPEAEKPAEKPGDTAPKA